MRQTCECPRATRGGRGLPLFLQLDDDVVGGQASEEGCLVALTAPPGSVHQPIDQGIVELPAEGGLERDVLVGDAREREIEVVRPLPLALGSRDEEVEPLDRELAVMRRIDEIVPGCEMR